MKITYDDGRTNVHIGDLCMCCDVLYIIIGPARYDDLNGEFTISMYDQEHHGIGKFYACVSSGVMPEVDLVSCGSGAALEWEEEGIKE